MNDILSSDAFRQAAEEYRNGRDRANGRAYLRPIIEDTSTPAGDDEGRFAPLDAYENEFVEQDSAPRKSRFFSASDFNGKPTQPREWLVEGLVPMNTVTLLSGDGGTGKSLLSLQLAVRTVTGGLWMGKPVREARAMFLTAEDDNAELHRRLDAIRAHYGIGYDDLQGLTLRSLAGEDALLAIDGPTLTASDLFRELEQKIETNAPALVVLDTLADIYPGNENDRAKARQFVGLLRGLAIRHGCAVVVLSHPSLTGLTTGSGASGSTGWNNSVRSRLYLSRVEDQGFEADPDKRVLTTKKANYGRVGEEITMTWREGVFVADAPETGLDRLSANAKAERVFLKLLDEHTAQGRYVSGSPSSTYAPTVFAKSPQAEGMTKRALTGAMEALFSRGEIVVAKHGTGTKARSHIARKGAENDA